MNSLDGSNSLILNIIMKYMKIFKTAWTLLLILLVQTYTNAVKLWTPKWSYYNNPDYPTGSEIVEWNRSIFSIISFINKYLWFAIWFFCFLFMVWNWYQLIMARWDEKQTKSATKSLLWSLIWIMICLLAYIIVNIAVKLFA